MRTVKVVTGYVPIPNHPRTALQYGELGQKLADAVSPVARLKAHYTRLEDCWLFKAAQHFGKLKHAEGDNPAKNTLAYHCVNHQKSEWLAIEAIDDAYDTDVFVWIDYGIFSIPGVTAPAIADFLGRVAQVNDQNIYIPGCWGPDYDRTDTSPCWRFCGSVLIMPRSQAPLFDKENKIKTLKNLKKSRMVTWEINDWARLERYTHLPIKWYKADHNDTMFTNFPPGEKT